MSDLTPTTGRRLLAAMRRLAAGDFTARMGPPYARGATGTLERALDELAATLGSRQVEAEAAGEALARSEARHRMLVEGAADGIIVFDGEGRLLDANPRACEMLGYSKDELRARRAGDLIVPEERTESARGLETLRATGLLTVERRLLRKDGHVLHAELRDRALPDGTFQAVVRDVTRQKAAEAQAQALAEAGRALMGTLDPEAVGGRIVTAALSVVGGRRACLYRVDPADAGRLVAFVAAGEPLPSDWMGQTIPLGVSLTGFAAAQRRPATSAHVRRDPRFPPGEWARTRPVDDDCHAWVSVPLIAGGDLIGALSLGDTSGRQFTPVEMDLLAGFGGTAALALRNARVFAESERRRAEAEALARTGRDLTERLDASLVADRVVRGVESLLECSSTSLRLRTPDGSLVRVAAAGADAARLILGHVLPPGQGMAHRAMAEGRSLQAPDLLAVPGVALPDDLARGHHASGKQAVLAIPLRAGGTMIGALSVARDTGRVVSDDEVKLGEAFADQAAAALQNARLYDEASGARARAEAAAEEARHAAEALRHSEARFRAMAEQSGAAMFFRRGGRFAYANPAAEALTGYSLDELKRMDFWEIAHPDARDEFRRIAADRDAGGPGPSRYGLKLLTRTGQERWVDVSVSGAVVEGESTAIGIAFDVTERRRAEQALRESEASLARAEE